MGENLAGRVAVVTGQADVLEIMLTGHQAADRADRGRRARRLPLLRPRVFANGSSYLLDGGWSAR